jgi:hypothetical protein
MASEDGKLTPKDERQFYVSLRANFKNIKVDMKGFVNTENTMMDQLKRLESARERANETNIYGVEIETKLDQPIKNKIKQIRDELAKAAPDKSIVDGYVDAVIADVNAAIADVNAISRPSGGRRSSKRRRKSMRSKRKGSRKSKRHNRRR